MLTKEQNKERMRKVRQKGAQPVGAQPKGAQNSEVHKTGAQEMMPAVGILPERPRYLTCSDGQVLDRLVPPVADLTRIHQMRMCNESSYNFHPSRGILPHSLAITKGSQTNIQAIKK